MYTESRDSSNRGKPTPNSPVIRRRVRELARDLLTLAGRGGSRERMARELGVSLGHVVQLLALIGAEVQGESSETGGGPYPMRS